MPSLHLDFPHETRDAQSDASSLNDMGLATILINQEGLWQCES